jgi:flagellar motor switch protein FliM
MKEILSNEEIDTLLELFRSEGAELDEPVAEELAVRAVAGDDEGPLVSPIDLLKPNRFSRDQLRRLERCFESAARGLAATMGDRLRLDVACDCVAVEQVRYGTWVQQLGGPCAIYALSMPPLEQPVLFTVTTSMLYGAVDRILGGTGKVRSTPRELTTAEYTVAEHFVTPILDRIAESLEEFCKVEWRVQSRFSNPSLANIVPDHDVVLSVYFQATGQSLLGDLRFVMPYTAIEAHLGEDVAAGMAFDGIVQQSSAMRDAIARSLSSSTIDLTVELGDSVLTLRELMDLRSGDVVLLRKRVGEPMVAPVRGVPKFLGQIGTRGNRLAFEVQTVLNEESAA